MTLHVRVSIAIYYQLYKVTSQVSLVTALIEQDNFLLLSSFMDKYFSGNAFKFLIFFNLLTFNKRVLSLAGSLAKSESHLLCVVIGCSPLMSHIHVHVLHKLRIKAWVDKKADDQHHGTNKARLEWFGLSTQN